MKVFAICAIFPMLLTGQQPDFNGLWRLRAEAGTSSNGMSLLWVSQQGADLDL